MLVVGDAHVKASREELYQYLWSESLGKVASRYRVSNTVLRDACQKYDIPVPNAVYWLAVRNDEPVERDPLPSWVEPPTEIAAVPVVTAVAESEPETPRALPPLPPPQAEKPKEADDEIAALMEAEADPANQIVVHEELRAPHPAVKRTKEAFKEARPDSYGRLFASYQIKDIFRLQVTKESVNRSLLILDALAKALEKRGYEVDPWRCDGQEHDVTVLHQGFVIGLREKVRRTERDLTKEEKNHFRQYGYVYAPDRYSYHSTGILEIQLFWDKSHSYPLTVLRDNKRRPLEQQLHQVVIELLRLVARARANEVARRQAEIQRAEQERLRKEEERRKKIEETRMNRLQLAAGQWSKVAEMRAYVQAVKEESLRRRTGVAEDEELTKWLRWAESYLEQTDPLGRSRKLPGFSDAEREVAGEEAKRNSLYPWSSANSWEPPRQPR